MAALVFIICRLPKKLKHVALKEIHYQLLNTCLIITYNGWNKCLCYTFQGCCLKLRHRRLSGERNYCPIRQIRTTYNIKKTYKLDKISDVFNTYLEVKTDLQLCLNFGCENFWLYNYKSYSKRKFNKTYNRALRNFIKNSYYNLCYYNP